MKTLAGMTVVGLLLLLLCVWERVDIVRVGYHIEQLKKQKGQLQRERDELRVKVSGMTSPERIARAATEKLGMGPPEQGQVVLVRVGPSVPSGAGKTVSEFQLAKNDLGGRTP